MRNIIRLKIWDREQSRWHVKFQKHLLSPIQSFCFSQCDVGKDGKVVEFKDIDSETDFFDTNFDTTVGTNK